MRENDANLVAPIYESGAREPAIRFGNVSFDKLVARFSYASLLHQRVAPVTISGLAIGVDGDGACEPFTRLLLLRRHEENVSGEQRGLINRRIQLQRSLVQL